MLGVLSSLSLTTDAGVWVDIHNVEATGLTEWRDANMGYPQGTAFTSNPAHPHTEEDGTVWSVVSTYVPAQDPGTFDSRSAFITLCGRTHSNSLVMQ